MAVFATPFTLRQGRKVRRTLYLQYGPLPSDDDPVVGLVDDPELAALIVTSVNEHLERAERRRYLAETVSDPGNRNCAWAEDAVEPG